MCNSIILYAAALICAGAGFQASSLAQTKITANDVVINGESFFEMSNITSELTRLARADGYIGANESFRQIAKSGYSISQILGLYNNCNPKPKYLISDGGGIDLMNGNCTDENCTVIKNCKTTLQQYLTAMKNGGTKKLLWMIYPDPQKNYSGTLKTNQDIWAKVVPPVINGCTDPKTLLVDLRPVWAGHYDQYTTDGIHPTNAGGTATATAFWKAIKDSNFFDIGNVPVKPNTAVKTVQSALVGQRVSNNTLFLSLSLTQPITGISMRITTVAGRIVTSAAKQEHFSGSRTVKFPLGVVASGVYCLEIQTGQFSERSSLLVQ